MTHVTLYAKNIDLNVRLEDLTRDCGNFVNYKLISKMPKLEIKENTILISNILDKDLSFWRGFLAGTLYPSN